MSKNDISKRKDSKTTWRGLHNKVNTLLQTFVSSHIDKYVPLGPLYGSMTFVQAERNLILHRLCKKFEEPNDHNALARKNKTVSDMFDYDKTWAITWFQPARDRTLDGFTRHQLYRARSKLREIVNTHYRFCVDNIGFPSGETVISSKGDVSLYAKMRDREQLCSTEGNFDRFVKLSYNHAGLRHVIKRHFRMMCNDNGINQRVLNKLIWRQASNQIMYKPHFAAYLIKCKYVISIVDAARITTVRKDNVKDRVIELDAFCNMVDQRTIANSVRELIKLVFEIDLDKSQLVHKLLIQDLDNATIDLKNASNSVWYKVVEWFLEGTQLWDDLKATRCGIVSFNDTKHSLNMLAPMGNGFTFEIMTLFLLTITREYDSFAHVFGDDIIVSRDVAPSVISMLQYLGFHINDEKTFISGYFRESCGGFTSHGKYITSFDLEWCEDEVDAVVAINKLYTLIHSTSDGELKSALTVLHGELLEAVPPLLLRGHRPKSNYAVQKIKSELNTFVVERFERDSTYAHKIGFTNICVTVSNTVSLTDDTFDLSSGVYISDLRYLQKAQRSCDTCKKHFASKSFADQRLDLNWNIKHGNQRLLPHVTLILRKTNKRYTFIDSKGKKRPWKPIDNVSRLIAHFYLSCGRVISPTFRKTYVSTNLVQHCLS